MVDIHAVVMDLVLPAGMLGAEPMEVDVRAYLVPHATGVVLVDAGMEADGTALDAGLQELGAGWSDVSHLVITHAHPDHIGALEHVRTAAPRAAVHAHPAEELTDTDPLDTDRTVGSLRVVPTSGHTPGHVSFLDEERNTLLVGDSLAGVGGRLGRAPRRFTTDPDLAEQTLHDLRALRGARMLFGHGPEAADPWDQLDALLES